MSVFQKGYLKRGLWTLENGNYEASVWFFKGTSQTSQATLPAFAVALEISKDETRGILSTLHYKAHPKVLSEESG